MKLLTPKTITHKDKTYHVSVLGLADLLEHAQWLRDEHMSEAKRHMVGLPFDLAKHAYDEARKEIEDIRLGTLKYFERLWHLKSITYALWLAIRKEDKGLELATVLEMAAEDYQACSEVAETALNIRREADPTEPEAPAQTTT
jgi:hypothetical protein